MLCRRQGVKTRRTGPSALLRRCRPVSPHGRCVRFNDISPGRPLKQAPSLSRGIRPFLRLLSASPPLTLDVCDGLPPPLFLGPGCLLFRPAPLQFFLFLLSHPLANLGAALWRFGSAVDLSIMLYRPRRVFA
eukprot:scaffold1661_cov251-Pinguiococcus_pyrenoidosus.AAC.34